MDWSFLIEGKDALCVSTDTRNLPRGCVFFALKGDNFDGNRFAAQALEQGAELAVIDDPKAFIGPRTVLVPDALKALQDLARAWRRALGLLVIGITGTNGKTTTKELMAAVLKTKYNIHYTQGNLNNNIGVPLTLLQLTREHALAIVEMGASHPGDINELVRVAEPDYGLITNVGRAHLQGFGSFEGVQRTKAELYDWLIAHNGIVFANADNAFLCDMWQQAGARRGGTSCRRIEYRRIPMPDGTHLVGDYNAENIAAALCVGEYFGVSRENGLTAIRAYVPSNNRSQRLDTVRNALVVDAYNANPTSMAAAINAFDGDTFILGGMRELGDYSHLEHQNIVNMLAERKADKVLLVGREWNDTTSPYPVYENADTLHAALEQTPLTGRKILLKGSRGIQLEKLLDIL